MEEFSSLLVRWAGVHVGIHTALAAELKHGYINNRPPFQFWVSITKISCKQQQLHDNRKFITLYNCSLWHRLQGLGYSWDGSGTAEQGPVSHWTWICPVEPPWEGVVPHPMAPCLRIILTLPVRSHIFLWVLTQLPPAECSVIPAINSHYTYHIFLLYWMPIYRSHVFHSKLPLYYLWERADGRDWETTILHPNLLFPHLASQKCDCLDPYQLLVVM